MGLFVSQHSGWSALAFGGNGGMKGAQQQLGFCQGGSEGERITAVGGSEIRRSPVEVVYPNKNKVSYIPTVVIGGISSICQGQTPRTERFFFPGWNWWCANLLSGKITHGHPINDHFRTPYILSLQRSQRVYTPFKMDGTGNTIDFLLGPGLFSGGHVSFGECNPNQIKPLDYESLPFKNTTLSTLRILWLWYTRSDYWKYNWSLLRGYPTNGHF